MNPKNSLPPELPGKFYGRLFDLISSSHLNLRLTVYKLLHKLGICTYNGTFQDIPCFTSTIGALKDGAALALPGIGIFVHPADIQNTPLLRHEFGHMLQAKKWGKFFFYRVISWASLLSARKSNCQSEFNHQHTWTEWSANNLAYNFFNKPSDWPMKIYPIYPPAQRTERSRLPSGLTVS